MAGYVYAFASPSMAGIVKIGATTQDPAARLADANSADTWRPPEPYALVCSARVASAFATERALHCVLSARRVNARREFFRVSFDEARALFALLAESAYEGPADPVRASPGLAQQGLQSQEASLRSWVEANYTHIPLREKDSGTKLHALYAAYFSATPPVHFKILGRNTFARMLGSIYPGVGPHRNLANTATGIYLLR
jgi:hypothetical protein